MATGGAGCGTRMRGGGGASGRGSAWGWGWIGPEKAAREGGGATTGRGGASARGGGDAAGEGGAAAGESGNCGGRRRDRDGREVGPRQEGGRAATGRRWGHGRRRRGQGVSHCEGHKRRSVLMAPVGQRPDAYGRWKKILENFL